MQTCSPNMIPLEGTSKDASNICDESTRSDSFKWRSSTSQDTQVKKDPHDYDDSLFGCGTCHQPWHYSVAFSNRIIPGAVISTNEVFIAAIWFSSKIQCHQNTASISSKIETSGRENSSTCLATPILST